MLDGDTEKLQRHSSAGNSVAVLSGTAVSVEVVGLWTFTLNTGAIHGSGAVQLIVGVTPAAQTRLEAIFELLTDKVEDNGIYAGVDCCKVDAKVVQDQQEIEQLTSHFLCLVVNHLLKNPAEVQWEPAEGKDEDEGKDSFGHLSPLFEVLTESDPEAAIPAVEHLAGHESVEDSCANQWYAKVEAKQPPVLCISVELHEGTPGSKHASAHGFVGIVEGDYVETDGLRHCQDE